MVRTWESGIVAVETCPVCASLQVRTVEPDWFVLELERADELRRAEEFAVEFACRECGSVWS
ncbi:hypothetical protein [Microbacterium sp. SS28]|uniref:hypothetical protein n=1 Tax=Microbacterium sp. SS28 TaxID=2919948 RepID=UPI001FA9ED06|nr:hypothetical protein [Microbacterium sp. SS28]